MARDDSKMDKSLLPIKVATATTPIETAAASAAAATTTTTKAVLRTLNHIQAFTLNAVEESPVSGGRRIGDLKHSHEQLLKNLSRRRSEDAFVAITRPDLDLDYDSCIDIAAAETAGSDVEKNTTAAASTGVVELQLTVEIPLPDLDPILWCYCYELIRRINVMVSTAEKGSNLVVELRDDSVSTNATTTTAATATATAAAIATNAKGSNTGNSTRNNALLRAAQLLAQLDESEKQRRERCHDLVYSSAPVSKEKAAGMVDDTRQYQVLSSPHQCTRLHRSWDVKMPEGYKSNHVFAQDLGQFPLPVQVPQGSLLNNLGLGIDSTTLLADFEKVADRMRFIYHFFCDFYGCTDKQRSGGSLLAFYYSFYKNQNRSKDKQRLISKALSAHSYFSSRKSAASDYRDTDVDVDDDDDVYVDADADTDADYDDYDHDYDDKVAEFAAKWSVDSSEDDVLVFNSMLRQANLISDFQTHIARALRRDGFDCLIENISSIEQQAREDALALCPSLRIILQDQKCLTYDHRNPVLVPVSVPAVTASAPEDVLKQLTASSHGRTPIYRLFSFGRGRYQDAASEATTRPQVQNNASRFMTQPDSELQTKAIVTPTPNTATTATPTTAKTGVTLLAKHSAVAGVTAIYGVEVGLRVQSTAEKAAQHENKRQLMIAHRQLEQRLWSQFKDAVGALELLSSRCTVLHRPQSIANADTLFDSEQQISGMAFLNWVNKLSSWQQRSQLLFEQVLLSGSYDDLSKHKAVIEATAATETIKANATATATTATYNSFTAATDSGESPNRHASLFTDTCAAPAPAPVTLRQLTLEMMASIETLQACRDIFQQLVMEQEGVLATTSAVAVTTTTTADFRLYLSFNAPSFASEGTVPFHSLVLAHLIALNCCYCKTEPILRLSLGINAKGSYNVSNYIFRNSSKFFLAYALGADLSLGYKALKLRNSSAIARIIRDLTSEMAELNSLVNPQSASSVAPLIPLVPLKPQELKDPALSFCYQARPLASQVLSCQSRVKPQLTEVYESKCQGHNPLRLSELTVYHFVKHDSFKQDGIVDCYVQIPSLDNLGLLLSQSHRPLQGLSNGDSAELLLDLFGFEYERQSTVARSSSKTASASASASSKPKTHALTLGFKRYSQAAADISVMWLQDMAAESPTAFTATAADTSKASVQLAATRKPKASTRHKRSVAMSRTLVNCRPTTDKYRLQCDECYIFHQNVNALGNAVSICFPQQYAKTHGGTGYETALDKFYGEHAGFYIFPVVDNALLLQVFAEICSAYYQKEKTSAKADLLYRFLGSDGGNITVSCMGLGREYEQQRGKADRNTAHQDMDDRYAQAPCSKSQLRMMQYWHNAQLLLSDKYNVQSLNDLYPRMFGHRDSLQCMSSARLQDLRLKMENLVKARKGELIMRFNQLYGSSSNMPKKFLSFLASNSANVKKFYEQCTALPLHNSYEHLHVDNEALKSFELRHYVLEKSLLLASCSWLSFVAVLEQKLCMPLLFLQDELLSRAHHYPQETTRSQCMMKSHYPFMLAVVFLRHGLRVSECEHYSQLSASYLHRFIKKNADLLDPLMGEYSRSLLEQHATAYYADADTSFAVAAVDDAEVAVSAQDIRAKLQRECIAQQQQHYSATQSLPQSLRPQPSLLPQLPQLSKQSKHSPPRSQASVSKDTKKDKCVNTFADVRRCLRQLQYYQHYFSADVAISVSAPEHTAFKHGANAHALATTIDIKHCELPQWACEGFATESELLLRQYCAYNMLQHSLEALKQQLPEDISIAFDYMDESVRQDFDSKLINTLVTHLQQESTTTKGFDNKNLGLQELWQTLQRDLIHTELLDESLIVDPNLQPSPNSAAETIRGRSSVVGISNISSSCSISSNRCYRSNSHSHSKQQQSTTSKEHSFGVHNKQQRELLQHDLYDHRFPHAGSERRVASMVLDLVLDHQKQLQLCADEYDFGFSEAFNKDFRLGLASAYGAGAAHAESKAKVQVGLDFAYDPSFFATVDFEDIGAHYQEMSVAAKLARKLQKKWQVQKSVIETKQKLHEKQVLEILKERLESSFSVQKFQVLLSNNEASAMLLSLVDYYCSFLKCHGLVYEEKCSLVLKHYDAKLQDKLHQQIVLVNQLLRARKTGCLVLPEISVRHEQNSSVVKVNLSFIRPPSKTKLKAGDICGDDAITDTADAMVASASTTATDADAAAPAEHARGLSLEQLQVSYTELYVRRLLLNLIDSNISMALWGVGDECLRYGPHNVKVEGRPRRCILNRDGYSGGINFLAAALAYEGIESTLNFTQKLALQQLKEKEYLRQQAQQHLLDQAKFRLYQRIINAHKDLVGADLTKCHSILSGDSAALEQLSASILGQTQTQGLGISTGTSTTTSTTTASAQDNQKRCRANRPNFEAFLYTLEALEQGEAMIIKCECCGGRKIVFNPHILSLETGTQVCCKCGAQLA